MLVLLWVKARGHPPWKLVVELFRSLWVAQRGAGVSDVSTCVSVLDRTTGDLVQRSRKSRSELRQVSAKFSEDLRPIVESLAGFARESSDRLQPFYPMFGRLLFQG